MFDDQDPLFNIIHTLPVSSQSVAHASRRPTAGYSQHPKYLPDYGGVLDIPDSNLKNRSLEQEMPFKPKPKKVRVAVSNNYTSRIRPLTEDCLIAVSYLKNVDKSEKFSLIRALDRHLHVDLVDGTLQARDEAGCAKSICYAHVPYSEVISGIKLNPNAKDRLLVKFDQGVKVINLNDAYKLPPESCDSSDDTSSDDLSTVEREPALDFLATVNERIGIQVKDTCMNPFNKTILCVASENFESRIVKLYDLSVGCRQPFHSIMWPSEETNQTMQEQLPISATATSENEVRVLRKRVIRTYTPVPSIIDGIKQVEHNPHHLANMMLSNARQIFLIDPRLDTLGQIYADKENIPSFYPIEYLRRFEFSIRNEYQFYSLSNIHLRVFDTRYPCTPMSQVNHMLESETYDAMNMKIIRYEDSFHETVCSSSMGRLSFLTFDHERAKRLANPSSPHHPYHEPSPAEISEDESEDLFGLTIVSEQLANSSLFSVLQLSAAGTVCYRKFESRDYEPDLSNADDENYIISIVQREKERRLTITNTQQSVIEDDSDATERYELDDVGSDDTEIHNIDDDSDNEINILDQSSSVDVASKVESIRAKESYEKMKNKLGVQE